MWLAESNFECPKSLLDKTRTLPRARVAIVNAQSVPVLESVRQAVAEDLIEPILIGQGDQMQACAQAASLDIANFKTVLADDDHQAVNCATTLVNNGDADFIMKGHIHTDDFLRGLINKETGIRGEGFMTHTFYMTVPGSEKPLMITDAAIHVKPDEKALKSIITNAVTLAQKLGIPRPKVALLSASETPSEAVPSSMVAESLAQWAEQSRIWRTWMSVGLCHLILQFQKKQQKLKALIILLQALLIFWSCRNWKRAMHYTNRLSITRVHVPPEL